MTECCSGSAGERSELLAGGRSGQEIAGGEPMANACSASCACAWARGARTPPEERQSLNVTAASPAPLDRSPPPPHRPPWGRCTERRATGARTRSDVRPPQRKLTPVVDDVPPSSSHQPCGWRPPMRALPRSQRLSLSKPPTPPPLLMLHCAFSNASHALTGATCAALQRCGVSPLLFPQCYAHGATSRSRT